VLFNIVTNVPGCVLIKIWQNFPNKVGFYKYFRFSIKGNEQPTVEVLLIESEIAMICIRKNTGEGQFDSNIHYQLHNSCTTVNANTGRMESRYGSLFVKTFNYPVGYTLPATILHLTGFQQLPTDEFGYMQHSFKEDFRFSESLELVKEYVTESSLYDHNKLELEHHKIKRKYNEWKSMSWDKKMDLNRRYKQRGSRLKFQTNRRVKQCVLVSSQTYSMSTSANINWAIADVDWATLPAHNVNDWASADVDWVTG
jgi:hypothetical protein